MNPDDIAFPSYHEALGQGLLDYIPAAAQPLPYPIDYDERNERIDFSRGIDDINKYYYNETYRCGIDYYRRYFLRNKNCLITFLYEDGRLIIKDVAGDDPDMIIKMLHDLLLRKKTLYPDITDVVWTAGEIIDLRRLGFVKVKYEEEEDDDDDDDYEEEEFEAPIDRVTNIIKTTYPTDVFIDGKIINPKTGKSLPKTRKMSLRQLQKQIEITRENKKESDRHFSIERRPNKYDIELPAEEVARQMKRTQERSVVTQNRNTKRKGVISHKRLQLSNLPMNPPGKLASWRGGRKFYYTRKMRKSRRKYKKNKK